MRELSPRRYRLTNDPHSHHTAQYPSESFASLSHHGSRPPDGSYFKRRAAGEFQSENALRPPCGNPLFQPPRRRGDDDDDDWLDSDVRLLVQALVVLGAVVYCFSALVELALLRSRIAEIMCPSSTHNP